MPFMPITNQFHLPYALAGHLEVNNRHAGDGSRYEPSEDGSSVSENGTEDGTANNRFTLKGTRFTGMGGFDAATEDQRRMRNQRKPKEVTDQLEASSRLITTVEVVCDLNLVPQRKRDVYDEPSEDESIVSYSISPLLPDIY